MAIVTTKKALLTVCLTSLLAGAAQAQSQDRITNPPPPTYTAEQKQTLEKLFSPFVKNLERPMLTFSYQPASDKLQPQSHWDVERRVLGWSRRFFDAQVHDGNMVGPGFYLAIDPYSSRSFGGQDPTLFAVTLRKGALILNATANFDVEQTKALSQVYTDLKCDPNSTAILNRGLSEVIKGFRQSTNQLCRELIIDVLGKLRVGAILYSYSASDSIEGCRQNRNEALNLISGDAVDEDSINYYTEKNKIEGKPMGSFIRKLYEESENGFEVNFSIGGQGKGLPSGTSDFVAAQQFYKHWKKNLYKCGPQWSFEKDDGGSGDLTMNIKLTFGDRQVRVLLMKLKKAYLQRVKTTLTTTTFDVTKMNQIMKASYRASGLANDDSKFDQWLMAKAMMNDWKTDSDQRLKNVAALLGETYVPDSSKGMQIATDFPKKYDMKKRNPNLVFDAYAQMGYGPRLARMQIDSFIVTFMGMAPFLSPEPFTGGDHDVEIVDSNIREFRKILRTCIDEYEDQSKDVAQILMGDCGIAP